VHLLILTNAVLALRNAYYLEDGQAVHPACDDPNNEERCMLRFSTASVRGLTSLASQC
jgi:hypothetical protein